MNMRHIAGDAVLALESRCSRTAGPITLPGHPVRGRPEDAQKMPIKESTSYCTQVLFTKTYVNKFKGELARMGKVTHLSLSVNEQRGESGESIYELIAVVHHRCTLCP
jgi:hypothetical protein